MDKNLFNLVLHEPQIPQNTGNIIRLCACTGSNLYIVGKPGFFMTDKYLKRAGLDYVESVNILQMNTFEELWKNYPRSNFYYLSTKAKISYTEKNFQSGDFFIFGNENKGLPEDIIFSNFQTTLRIPMADNQRSLNLSNSVAIVVYEAIRQNLNQNAT